MGSANLSCQGSQDLVLCTLLYNSHMHCVYLAVRTLIYSLSPALGRVGKK